MNIQEMKKLNKQELLKELGVLKQELETSKADISSGKEKNVRKSLRIKRNIARIQTVLNELETKDE